GLEREVLGVAHASDRACARGRHGGMLASTPPTVSTSSTTNRGDDADEDLADPEDAEEAVADGGGERAGAVHELPPGADPSIDWGLTSHLGPDGSPRIIERHLHVPPELAGLRPDHLV